MATAAELIDEIKKMSVLELSELIKALEEEFGVSATAVAAAAPAEDVADEATQEPEAADEAPAAEDAENADPGTEEE